MSIKKSKPLIVPTDLYRRVSDAIHGSKASPDEPSVAEKLRAFAEQQLHLNDDPEDFEPTIKGTYLQLLSDYYVAGSDSSSSEHGLRGPRMVNCLCVCGNEVTLPYRAYTKKVKTSCGCKEENISVRCESHAIFANRLPYRVQDMTVQGVMRDGVFGYWKVLSYILVNGLNRWVTECVCGHRKTIARRQLLTLKNPHCGSKQCAKLFAEGYDRKHATSMFSAQNRELAESARRDPLVTRLNKPRKRRTKEEIAAEREA